MNGGGRRRKNGNTKKRSMRGGGYADVSAPYTHGDFVGGQHSPVPNAGSVSNVALAQSGGRAKKRRHRGGGHVLQPATLGGEDFAPLSGGQPAPQKGGYMENLFKAALVPFGLMGLNKYAHDHSGKRPYMGKSRLSKRLRSRRR
jgi:hypothetical protein